MLTKILDDVYKLLLIIGALFFLLAIAGILRTRWFTIDVSKPVQRLPILAFGVVFLFVGLLPIIRPLGRSIDAPTIPVKSLGMSDFGNEWPRNNYGQEWKIFNDSKWLGKSVIWYEMVRRNQDNDHFMRIHFNLCNQPPTPAYCGIYTEFSDPPYGILDLSAYSGIEFEARYKTSTRSNPVRFLLQVAVLGIQNYAYHEADFIMPPGLEAFAILRIPFSKFTTPVYAGTQYEFDKRRVFRIALIIKGNGTSGIMDFDNLRLIQ